MVGRAVLFERDIYAYWVPAVEAFVRAIAEGAWPLWDPLTNFGRPLLADPNMQFAYPPTWLNLVLPPGAYYTLFVVCHCAWAAARDAAPGARVGARSGRRVLGRRIVDALGAVPLRREPRTITSRPRRGWHGCSSRSSA